MIQSDRLKTSPQLIHTAGALSNYSGRVGTTGNKPLVAEPSEGSLGYPPANVVASNSKSPERKIKNLSKMKEILEKERILTGEKRPTGQKSYKLEIPKELSQRGDNSSQNAQGMQFANHPNTTLSSAVNLTHISGANTSHLQPWQQTSTGHPEESRPELAYDSFGNLTKDRYLYSTTYGQPRASPTAYYSDVDLIHEAPGRYQEVNHWLSSREKPSEENIEVLKKINHDRINALHERYAQRQTELSELSRIAQNKADFEADFIRTSVVEHNASKGRAKSPLYKITEAKKFHGDFDAYMKDRSIREGIRTNNPEIMVDFDRYECTSPDPKRVQKQHQLLYKSNV